MTEPNNINLEITKEKVSIRRKKIPQNQPIITPIDNGPPPMSPNTMLHDFDVNSKPPEQTTNIKMNIKQYDSEPADALPIPMASPMNYVPTPPPPPIRDPSSNIIPETSSETSLQNTIVTNPDGNYTLYSPSGEPLFHFKNNALYDPSGTIVFYGCHDATTTCNFLKENMNVHIVKMMLLRQEVLNRKIGTQAWKKYISAAVWNYITTLINFAITLLTALSTGQAASTKLLDQQQTVIILFCTFILTITNSFFKLNIKMNLNFEAAKVYYKFGAEFEHIYYKKIASITDVINKLNGYELLHNNINEYILTETIENQNYLTELIYMLLINNTLARGLNSEHLTKWVNAKNRHKDLDGPEPIKNGLMNVFKPLKVDQDEDAIVNGVAGYNDRGSTKSLVGGGGHNVRGSVDSVFGIL